MLRIVFRIVKKNFTNMLHNNVLEPDYVRLDYNTENHNLLL